MTWMSLVFLLVRLGTSTQILRSDVTTVYPRQMTSEQTAAHVAGGSWQDKAGACAIQETGDVFVERIGGSVGRGLAMICAILCVQNVRFRDRIKAATGASGRS